MTHKYELGQEVFVTKGIHKGTKGIVVGLLLGGVAPGCNKDYSVYKVKPEGISHFTEDELSNTPPLPTTTNELYDKLSPPRVKFLKQLIDQGIITMNLPSEYGEYDYLECQVGRTKGYPTKFHGNDKVTRRTLAAAWDKHCSRRLMQPKAKYSKVFQLVCEELGLEA